MAGFLEHDGLPCSRMMRHLIELDMSSFYYMVSYCINGFISVSVDELLFLVASSISCQISNKTKEEIFQIQENSPENVITLLLPLGQRLVA